MLDLKKKNLEGGEGNKMLFSKKYKDWINYISINICKFNLIMTIYVFSFQAMHNYPLSESNHLRVSFSKSTI